MGNAESVRLQYAEIKESRMQVLSTHDLCEKCIQRVKRLMSENYGKTFDSEPAKTKANL
jgi:hypothetical protein